MACGSIASISSTATVTVSNATVTYDLDLSATVGAGTTTIHIPAMHHGVYDLSPVVLDYLDSALTAVLAAGAEPYLDFDYMPFELARKQDPNTAENLHLTDDALVVPRLTESP
jgi:hypothetical protein